MTEDKKQQIVSSLKDHFSRKWEFDYLVTKPHIKFKFKENKSNVKGRVYLDESKITLKIYGDEHSYQYAGELGENPEKFLEAFIALHPAFRGECSELDGWLNEWKKDKRKRNKPARVLYGFDG